MKKAQAMLDALMGPSRNSSAKATSDDWRDRKVCKTFLVAVCPYDKTMLGGRKNVEVCPKIHNETLREAFKAHADGAPDSSFRRDCEDKALRDLVEAIAARDIFARDQVAHKNAQLNIRPGGRNKEIGKMKRTVCEIKEKADLIDDTESVANAALKAQLLKEYAEGLEEYEAVVKEEERKAEEEKPKAKSCKVCGTAYVGDDDYNLHTSWTRHTTYLQIEEHLAALRKKQEERATKKLEAGNDDGKTGKRKSRSRGRDKTAEKNDRNDDGDSKNAKPRKKSRSGSREKDNARDNDKEKKTGRPENEETKDRSSGKRKSRSRSRDRGKTRDKERNGGGSNRDMDRRRRDRSRSRGDRRRSRSHSRRRDQGRRR